MPTQPTKKYRDDRRSGVALVVVMSLTLLGTMAAASVAFSTSSRIRQAHRQMNMEKAFYLAEAGAERAASRIATGNMDPGTLTGNLGDGSYTAVIAVTTSGGGSQIDVTATGTVGGVERTIVLRGVRRVSWARYALWYDEDPLSLWITRIDKFYGPVYSTPKLRFHSDRTTGSTSEAHFYDKTWSAATSIDLANDTVKPIFDVPLRLGVDVETMTTIDFPELLTQASSGYVLDGPTTITISGTTMSVTNEQKDWNNKSMSVPADGLVYVRTSEKTVERTVEKQVWNKKKRRWDTVYETITETVPIIGDLTIKAPGGLDGRLTFVAENDILIADHVRYKKNPISVPDSDDALGLIAQRSVVVQTTAPNNLDIFAHMICRDGGFGVDEYGGHGKRGYLNVYGGIANKIRNAVGYTDGTGFTKNYVFDRRFESNPPPCYPKLVDQLEWQEWNG